jgi:hypothetical protein
MESLCALIVNELRNTNFANNTINLDNIKNIVTEIDPKQLKKLVNYLTGNNTLTKACIITFEDFLILKLDINLNTIEFMHCLLALLKYVKELELPVQITTDQIIALTALILKIAFTIIPQNEKKILTIFAYIDISFQMLKLQFFDSTLCRCKLLSCFPCFLCSL